MLCCVVVDDRIIADVQSLQVFQLSNHMQVRHVNVSSVDVDSLESSQFLKTREFGFLVYTRDQAVVIQPQDCEFWQLPQLFECLSVKCCTGNRKVFQILQSGKITESTRAQIEITESQDFQFRHRKHGSH